MYYIDSIEFAPIDHSHSRLSHHPDWVSYTSENPIEDEPPLEEYILENVHLHALNKHGVAEEQGPSDVDDAEPPQPAEEVAIKI